MYFFKKRWSLRKRIVKFLKAHHIKLDPDTKFLFSRSDKLYPHDKLLAATVLKLFPKWVKPNHVTMFRFMATPIVILFVLYENYLVGLIAFILVAFTDAIDGSLARTRHKITNWGKVYDPLADKILIGSMVFIIVLRYIDIWTSFFIILMEAIIIATAWWRKREGGRIEANIWGKIKMCLQVFGVSILMISVIYNWAVLLPIASGTLYLAIAFSIVSLLTQGI